MPSGTRDDGSQFPLCMYFDSFDSIAFADTYAELLDVLIPGYADLSSKEQLRARIEMAALRAVWVQAQVWSENTEPLTPAQEEALAAPRLGSNAPTGHWTAPVPLVVLSVAYEPYTDIPAPTHEPHEDPAQEKVWMLHPTTDLELLTSLHEVGVIRLLHSSQ